LEGGVTGLWVGLLIEGGVTGLGFGLAVAAGGVIGEVTGINFFALTFGTTLRRSGNINTEKATKKLVDLDEILIVRNYRLYIIICQFALFGIVFAWWPSHAVPFEVPKVIFFQWMVRLLVIGMLISMVFKKHNWNPDNKISRVVVIFSIWLIFSALTGLDPLKSFAGNYYRSDGLITFFSLFGLAFGISYFWKPNYIIHLAETLYLTAIVLSAITLYKITSSGFGLGNAATFGNPVFLAGYLSVSLPFSLYLAKVKVSKIYYLGIFIQILAVLLIGAISSILTILLFAILIVIFMIKKRNIKYLAVFLLFLTALLITGFWLKDYYKTNSQSLIAEGRARIFINGWEGFRQRPLTGYGFANFDYVFEKGSWPLKLNDDVYVDKAHSGMFEMLVTTGIPGFILYLSLLYLIFKKLYIIKGDLWKFTLFSVALLYLFHSQTNVISITEEMLFWIVVGISL